MKKQRISILLVLTAVFAAFVLGLFLGQQLRPEPSAITISLPEAMQTVPETTVSTEPAETQGIQYPININTADRETLMALPGIGDVLAQRIILYRDSHGPYTHIEQLMNIEDIGPTRFEAITELITTGG